MGVRWCMMDCVDLCRAVWGVGVDGVVVEVDVCRSWCLVECGCLLYVVAVMMLSCFVFFLFIFVCFLLVFCVVV